MNSTAAPEDSAISESLIVHLADGRTIDVGDAATAQQVIERFFDRLRLDYQNDDGSAKAMAVWVCGRNLRLQLMPEQSIAATREKMKQLIKNIPAEEEDDPIQSSEIIFRIARNGFWTVADEEAVDDLTILKLLYFEAKKNIQENIYPRTDLGYDQMLALRVIEGFIEKKLSESGAADYSGAAKAIGTELSYKNSLKKVFLKRSLSKRAVKVNRQSSNKNFDAMNEFDLYKEYLKICRQLNCYGGFVFEGQMERSFLESITHGEYYDKKVGIIINGRGLHVVNLHCPKGQLFIKLQDLDWGIILPRKDNYIPCLYVKDKDKCSTTSKLYQIFTYHAPFIDMTVKKFLESWKVAHIESAPVTPAATRQVSTAV